MHCLMSFVVFLSAKFWFIKKKLYIYIYIYIYILSFRWQKYISHLCFVFVHSPPNSWNFLSVESDQGVIYEWGDFWKHLRMGACCQENQPYSYRLALSLISRKGRGAEGWIHHHWPMGLVNHGYIMTPPLKTKQNLKSFPTLFSGRA